VLLGNGWGLANYYATSTVPLDKVAGLIAEQMEPGDGIVLSSGAAGRWGIAYYLGSERQTALAGLDVSELGETKLIRSLDQVRPLRRVWVVLPPEEESAIDFQELRREMPQIWSTHVGNMMVSRLTR
jgi:hypothetical protein